MNRIDEHNPTAPGALIGWYTATKKEKVLRVVPADDRGQLITGKRILVAGKRDARRICKEKGATPWNF